MFREVEIAEFLDLGFHLLFCEARDGVVGVLLGELGEEEPLDGAGVSNED